MNKLSLKLNLKLNKTQSKKLISISKKHLSDFYKWTESEGKLYYSDSHVIYEVSAMLHEELKEEVVNNIQELQLEKMKAILDENSSIVTVLNVLETLELLKSLKKEKDKSYYGSELISIKDNEISSINSKELINLKLKYLFNALDLAKSLKIEKVTLRKANRFVILESEYLLVAIAEFLVSIKQ